MMSPTSYKYRMHTIRVSLFMLVLLWLAWKLHEFQGGSSTLRLLEADFQLPAMYPWSRMVLDGQEHEVFEMLDAPKNEKKAHWIFNQTRNYKCLR